MSKELIQKHPGYYVDASLYDIKPRKKKDTGQELTLNPQHQVLHKAETKQLPNTSTNMPEQKTEVSPRSSRSDSEQNHSAYSTVAGLNVKVYLTNTPSAAHGICPECNSHLEDHNVNIPVIEENGDFYRYYSMPVICCGRCQKAFITKDAVVWVLKKINSSTPNSHIRSVKLENATVQRSKYGQEYLFNPTLDNTNAIYCPEHDYHSTKSRVESDSMVLNSQSFLGAMGYSVSEGINVRRSILKEAVAKYGKRKVADHIAFLISMRRAQADGEERYANAIWVWQNDLNYISNL